MLSFRSPLSSAISSPPTGYLQKLHRLLNERAADQLWKVCYPERPHKKSSKSYLVIYAPCSTEYCNNSQMVVMQGPAMCRRNKCLLLIRSHIARPTKKIGSLARKIKNLLFRELLSLNKKIGSFSATFARHHFVDGRIKTNFLCGFESISLAVSTGPCLTFFATTLGPHPDVEN